MDEILFLFFGVLMRMRLDVLANHLNILFSCKDDTFDFCCMQNTIIDERGSFAVSSPYPGPLGVLLKSLKKVVHGIYMFSFETPILSCMRKFLHPSLIHCKK